MNVGDVCILKRPLLFKETGGARRELLFHAGRRVYVVGLDGNRARVNFGRSPIAGQAPDVFKINRGTLNEASRPEKKRATA